MSTGFTGTQRGMTDVQRFCVETLLSVRKGEFHHGDCIGADAQAHEIAQGLGFQIVLHPPIDEAKRAFSPGCWMRRQRKPYLDRNKDIVRETRELIAAPGEDVEQLRSGTWSTVRFARKLKRPIYIVMPDGRTVTENVDNAGVTISNPASSSNEALNP